MDKMSKGRKANPAKRATRRSRTKSVIAKSLETEKFRQQVIPKKIVEMTHKELVNAIQEEEEFRC